MKYIQKIDGAVNCVYDIFGATDEEFSVIFPEGQDIAFIDEVLARESRSVITKAFEGIHSRPTKKKDAVGIHGILFYELEDKKPFYPNRRDEDAINPDGSRLRHNGAWRPPAGYIEP